MATVPQTKVVITGESAGAVKAVKAVTSEMASMQGASLKVLSTLQSLAGLGAVAALTTLTKQAIDSADALDELSQRTGVAVEDLSKLQYAANLTGVSSEQLAKGLITLNGELAAAAAGNKESAEKFAALGISIRDTDGRVRGAMPVLRDLADAIADLPAGAAQTNAAISIFGSKVGKDLVLALNGGSEALDKFFTELEDLGGVMSSDMAKAAGQMNENMDKLRTVSGSVGIVLANDLVPVLNVLLEKFLAFRKSGATLADIVFGVNIFDQGKSSAELLDITKNKIAALEKQAESYRRKNKEDDIDVLYEIDRQKRLLKNFTAQEKIDSGEKAAEDTAAKRLALQRKLTTEIAKLEDLRAQAAGTANAKIAVEAKDLIDAQIKDAQRLQDALRSAWQTTVEEAKKARDESAKLQGSAADIRAQGKEKADEVRNAGISDSDRAFIAERDAAALTDSATTAALESKLAASFRRTENAAKLADRATKDAERAAKLVDRIADPRTRANAIERASEAQAIAEEARAKIKEQEAVAADERAAALQTNIETVTAQIESLQQKLGAMALEVDIAQAVAAVAEVQAQLAAIPDVTVKALEIQVKRTGDSGGEGGSADGEAAASFARGGWTGPGGKWQPAGIVHAGEYVLPQEVVRQRGMLAFLERLRRQGISALPGFADGGLVGRLSLPTLRAQLPAQAARATAVFNFPGMGRYSVGIDHYTLNRLQNDLARAALQKGGRSK